MLREPWKARKLAKYRRALYKSFRDWQSFDATIPPPHLIKQMVILDHFDHSFAAFVETGTYLGEMVEAMAPFFRRVHTIELSKELHRTTSSRLAHVRNVCFHLGDSGEVLGDVIPQISGKILFWLDGHYSGGITAQGHTDTPILSELAHITQHPNVKESVILVDDARCFTGEGEYEHYPTLSFLKNWVGENMSSHHLDVNYDIIRILPQNSEAVVDG